MPTYVQMQGGIVPVYTAEELKQQQKKPRLPQQPQVAPPAPQTPPPMPQMPLLQYPTHPQMPPQYAYPAQPQAPPPPPPPAQPAPEDKDKIPRKTAAAEVYNHVKGNQTRMLISLAGYFIIMLAGIFHPYAAVAAVFGFAGTNIFFIFKDQQMIKYLTGKYGIGK